MGRAFYHFAWLLRKLRKKNGKAAAAGSVYARTVRVTWMFADATAISARDTASLNMLMDLEKIVNVTHS